MYQIYRYGKDEPIGEPIDNQKLAFTKARHLTVGDSTGYDVMTWPENPSPSDEVFFSRRHSGELYVGDPDETLYVVRPVS